MRMPAARFEDLGVWQEAHLFVLEPTVCLGPSPNLKPLVCRPNFGALPSPLPRTVRKGSRNAEKETNSVFAASHQVPSKNFDAI